MLACERAVERVRACRCVRRGLAGWPNRATNLGNGTGEDCARRPEAGRDGNRCYGEISRSSSRHVNSCGRKRETDRSPRYSVCSSWSVRPYVRPYVRTPPLVQRSERRVVRRVRSKIDRRYRSLVIRGSVGRWLADFLAVYLPSWLDAWPPRTCVVRCGVMCSQRFWLRVHTYVPRNVRGCRAPPGSVRV